MYGICRSGAIPAIVACLLAFHTTASAQEPRPSDGLRERSEELYQESVDEYRAGRFGVAAQLLREAYRTYPHPNLLYNLARAHEGAGDLESAIRAYEAFLDAADEAEDRAAIERRIDTLRYQIAEREDLVEDHLKALEERELAITAARRERVAPGPAPWLLGGAGLAAVASGTVLAAVAMNDQDEAFDDISLVTLTAGTLLITAAAAWLAIALAGPDEP